MLNTVNIRSFIFVLPVAMALSACQVETVGEAVSTPQVAPVAAGPAPSVSVQGAGVISEVGPITGRVAADGVRWGTTQTGRNNEVIFAGGDVRNIGGLAAVCGVKTEGGVTTRRFNHQVFRSFVFAIDGQEILRDVNYFARAGSFEALETTPARCKTTSTPWKPEYANANWTLTYEGGSRFSF